MDEKANAKTYAAALGIVLVLFVTVPVLGIIALGWPLVWHAEGQLEMRKAAMQPPPLDVRALTEIMARQQIGAMAQTK